MSLYQCEECGARENTAVGHFHGQGKKICSKCHTGKWHNIFPRIILPMGMFVTNKDGNLAHKETGDTDVRKYRLNPPTRTASESES